MCECDFTGRKYWDAVIILHPVRETSLMVLLGDYSFVAEQDRGTRLVLGNVRHKNQVELRDDSIFQVTSNSGIEVEIQMLPIVEYLVDHPEDLVILSVDLSDSTLNWEAIRKSERSKI